MKSYPNFTTKKSLVFISCWESSLPKLWKMKYKNEIQPWQEKKTCSKMMTYKYIWNVTSDNTYSFSHEEIICNLTLTSIRV
jgi:hypothetical protein